MGTSVGDIGKPETIGTLFFTHCRLFFRHLEKNSAPKELSFFKQNSARNVQNSDIQVFFPKYFFDSILLLHRNGGNIQISAVPWKLSSENKELSSENERTQLMKTKELSFSANRGILVAKLVPKKSLKKIVGNVGLPFVYY